MDKCGSRSYILRSNVINPRHLSIGDNVKIKHNSRIECITSYAGDTYKPSLYFGDNISVEQNFHLTCTNQIEIGNGCMISYNVGIQDSDHSFKISNLLFRDQKLKVNSVKLGNNCFIGAGSIILSGTVLGDNCVVGANSVVRGEFPPGSIIGGNPCKIIKY